LEMALSSLWRCDRSRQSTAAYPFGADGIFADAKMAVRADFVAEVGFAPRDGLHMFFDGRPSAGAAWSCGADTPGLGRLTQPGRYLTLTQRASAAYPGAQRFLRGAVGSVRWPRASPSLNPEP
jgi:hypothetical protein